MRYGSVCSGIEAATVAWHKLGWTPEWFSEIDPFPCAVLKHHYPDVSNFGDMTKFKEWSLASGSIDLLVGGTPCQSFSVAGLRAGLSDPRGSLMLTYLAIAAETSARWLVWENVPGVLSSNGGRDFGTFLGGLAELGYGFAYRVLDAQYFGVPQRRRRVFVVGYLGDWRRAATVLFERHSLSWNPAPSREKGEEIAGTITASPSTTRSPNVSNGQATIMDSASLVVHGTQDQCVGIHTAFALGRNNGGENAVCFTGEITHTLKANGFDGSEDGSGRGQPITSTKNRLRRLTPIECERLQGFRDGYTMVTFNGKPAKDGPRYKAIGNSMAVPCMKWIGNRINLLELHHEH